ncbi:MAG TPA: hypothetical protein VHE12_02170 [bacterium]|nr:hypothetical protein [bacterium]
MNFAILPDSHTNFSLSFQFLWVLPFVGSLLLFLEWALAKKLLPKKVGPFWKPILLTHLPWLGLLAAPWVLSLHLPAPHDFPERKLEVLFGVLWLTHLFLFARLLLAGSYKTGPKDSTLFGSVGLFLFLGATLWTASVCDLSGDEPHYLLMAYSLAHDGDLDLANNYANHDYEKFYHRGVLEPQGLEHVIEGRRYSHHPLGPALLVLPGFVLAGRLGAALTMALLAALALFLSLRVLEESGAKGWPVHATGIIGLFSSPLLLFSGLVFPEIPTAVLVALGMLLFLKKRWNWLGLTLGLMLWMHNRNALILIPFGLVTLWEILKEKDSPRRREDAKKNKIPKTKFRDILNLAVGFAIPVALLSLYFRVLYGVWTPLGAHNEPFTSLFRLDHFWNGFFGLLLDQECGLWFHFPAFGLAVTGGALLWMGKKPLGRLVVATSLFFYLFMSFYENLGLTPAARYWVGLTPMLLVMIHPAVEDLKNDGWGKRLALLSVAVGVLVDWLLAAVPWMRYNKLEGENMILKIAGGFLHLPLASWEPAFQAPVVAWQSYVVGAFWVLVSVGFTAWVAKRKTH